MTSRNQTLVLILLLLLLLWAFSKDVLATVGSWLPPWLRPSPPVDAEHPAPNTGEFEGGGGEFGGHGAGGSWLVPPVDQNTPTPEPPADVIIPLPTLSPPDANPPAYRPPPSAAPDPQSTEGSGYDIGREYIGGVAHYFPVPHRIIV